MKKRDDKNQPELTEKEKLLEALVGSDEDFEVEECSDEYLSAFGIDPTTLVSEFKEHLEERARRRQQEEGSVPDSISNALRGIRDHIKASDPMNVDPETHIEGLLGGMILPPKSTGEYAYLFRKENDEEICEEDKELLDGIRAELDED